MHVLFLVPQPLYQVRGSSIAAANLLRILSERGEQVDVITYPEGTDIDLHQVKLLRVPAVPGVRNIRPGFSWKKLVYDGLMFFKALDQVTKHRYDVIHAAEEAAFIALFLKLLYRIPYVYDMDSSLAQQLVEQCPSLTPFSRVLSFFERLVVSHAQAVIPVCDALARVAENYGPKRVTILHDISLIGDAVAYEKDNLRERLGLDGQICMYVGNLQPYQGIDLLLKSFALAQQSYREAHLVIIGGEKAHIADYSVKAADLGIQQRTHFLGTRPIECLADYLAQADVLVSPRIVGRNTPMKIYSYLESGKALLATDLDTHTQVLTPQVALLSPPEAEPFARGLVRLLQDRNLCETLGIAGKALVEEKFSHAVFRRTVDGLFDWLQVELTTDASQTAEALRSVGAERSISIAGDM